MESVVYGLSVTGSDHLLCGAECMDRNSFCASDISDGPIKVIAIADGHGGARYVRSARGASFAVDIAKTEMRQTLERMLPWLDRIDSFEGDIAPLESQIKNELELLKGAILMRWKTEVDRDLLLDPIAVAGEARELYGTTLVAVAQYKHHIFALQLGDGDVTLVGLDGELESPMPRDENMVAGQTHSLCQENAFEHFEARYIRREIKIALLSTDGVVNALEDERGLFEIARCLWESLNEDAESFCREIEPYLNLFSGVGGDDCTFGLIANGISDKNYEFMKNAVAATRVTAVKGDN